MIRLEAVTAGYGGAPALRGVSLTVAAGQWLAVVGSNGSGKTTLLRAVAGLVPCRQGTVRIAGHDAARLAPRRRARLLAMVPQQPPVLPPVTVEDFVLLGRYPHHGPWTRPGPQDRAAARAALAETGADPLAHRLAPTLSAGELARVLLAQALAQDTPLLLLDEPAAHLDPAWAAQLMAVLGRRQRQGVTILMVVHDLNLAALHCPWFLALDAGAVAFHGPAEGFFSPARLETLYATPIHVLRHPVAGVPQTLPLPHASGLAGPGPAPGGAPARGLGRAGHGLGPR